MMFLNSETQILDIQEVSTTESRYQLYEEEFTDQALEYWDQFKITFEILKRFNVSFIRGFKSTNSQGELVTEWRKENELMFAFNDGDFVKVYRPNPESTWNIGNEAGDFFFGLKQLDLSSFGLRLQNSFRAHLFFAKDEMDVLALASVEVNAVAFKGRPEDIKEEIKELKQTFNKITVLFSGDVAADLRATEMCSLFGLRKGIFPDKIKNMGCNSVLGLNKLGLSINELIYQEPHDRVQNVQDVHIDEQLNMNIPLDPAIIESRELTDKYADYKINYILEPIIFENGNNIIGAERASGKTRFCLSLGMSIVYERNTFLGYKLHKYGNILYLNYEIHEPEFKLFVTPIENYFSSIAKKKHKFYSMSLLSHPEFDLKYLDSIVANLKPVLIVIDSFKAFMSPIMQENNQKELSNMNIILFYNLINNWRSTHKTTILITNHTNKNTKNQKSNSDLMFGPSSLMDYADHTFLLRKTDEPNQRLIIPDKVRFSSEIAISTNLVEIRSDDDQEKLWFDLVKENVDEGAYMYTGDKPDRENELDLVKSLMDQGLTQRGIAEETEFSVGKVNGLIKEIRDRG